MNYGRLVKRLFDNDFAIDHYKNWWSSYKHKNIFIEISPTTVEMIVKIRSTEGMIHLHLDRYNGKFIKPIDQFKTDELILEDVILYTKAQKLIKNIFAR